MLNSSLQVIIHLFSVLIIIVSNHFATFATAADESANKTNNEAFECLNGGTKYVVNQTTGEEICHCYVKHTGKRCEEASRDDPTFLFGETCSGFNCSMRMKCRSELWPIISLEGGGNGRDCFCNPLQSKTGKNDIESIAPGLKNPWSLVASCSFEAGNHPFVLDCIEDPKCKCRGNPIRFNLPKSFEYDGNRCFLDNKDDIHVRNLNYIEEVKKREEREREREERKGKRKERERRIREEKREEQRGPGRRVKRTFFRWVIGILLFLAAAILFVICCRFMRKWETQLRNGVARNEGAGNYNVTDIPLVGSPAADPRVVPPATLERPPSYSTAVNPSSGHRLYVPPQASLSNQVTQSSEEPIETPPPKYADCEKGPDLT